MSLTVQPSTSFEAVADGFSTGLAGTLGVRIIDNVGATTVARVTAGIAEYPAASGIYAKTLTAPSTAGQYTLVWDDGTTYATEDLTVTGSTLSALTGNLYATRAEVKTALSLASTDFADDDIDRACNSASRAIDWACSQGVEGPQRFFYPTSDTRYFTPEECATSVEVDDLVTLTTLSVALSGTSTYTTWTNGTQFTVAPVNATNMNRPYERIRLRRQYQTYWPRYDNAVKITGTFGWSEIPSEVNQYAVILATKLLYRTRQAPFGIIQVSGDIGAVARLARTDPDFETLLGGLVRTRPFV